MKTKPLAGKTITLPVFIRAEQVKSYGAIYNEIDGFDVFVSSYKGANVESFLLAEASVTFTVPASFDPTGPLVASLEAEKAKLTAEFAAAVSVLNRRLSELQAIEFSPSDVVEAA